MKKIFLLALIVFCSLVMAEGQTDANQKILASNQKELALKLFQTVAEANPNKNIVLSPFATAECLQMIYAGAKGTTEQELSQLLFSKNYGNILNQKNVHQTLSDIKKNMLDGSEGSAFELNFYSQAWAAHDAGIIDVYQNILKDQYQSGIQTVNFNDSAAAADLINGWVREQTESKIEKLIDKSILNANTKLVLTPVFGLKGMWLKAFDKSNTHKADFNIKANQSLQVDYLTSLDMKTKYYENNKAQIIQLPFANERYVMVIALPKAPYTLAQIEKGLTVAKLNMLQMMLNFSTKKSIKKLMLPKVDTKFDLSLKPTLEKLGVQSAFVPGKANFKGITGTKDLYLSDIVSSNSLTWNETSVVAFNATAAVFGIRGISRTNREGVEMIVNKPFLFILADTQKNTILEVGHIINPAE